MKIIPFKSITPEAEADFMPDSALLLPGRPMFFPEEGDGWRLEPHVAVRLNRLGKGVAPKFASRYYDAMTLALRLTLPGHRSPGLLSGMDASVVCGEWMALDDFMKLRSVSIEGDAIEMSADRDEIAAAIAAVSRLTTIKMGDIVLLPALTPTFGASPHTRVEVKTADGNVLLNLKIV
ncbi:MAG: hypothetical protein NC039_06420 [Muribaculaceae bacterium]|nr:hypothetical protein [Muribaculaceae bacterium]